MDKIQYKATYPVFPGETLYEVLREKKILQSQLGRAMKRPLKLINEICRGKASITPETALGLEDVLGIEAQFWLNLQSSYDLSVARGKRDLYAQPSTQEDSTMDA